MTENLPPPPEDRGHGFRPLGEGFRHLEDLVRAVTRSTLALDARLLLLAFTVGGLSGLLACGYYFALEYLLELSRYLDGVVSVLVIMPVAGLIVGATYLLGHPGETDAVVDNIHVHNGRIDTRANLPLVPCSLVSIAAGGSAGPEAPMVYLTGSVGTWLHRWLRLPENYVRTLTLTGMGVGFATLFGAPIGSAIFALEIPHKRGMEYYEATVPAIIGGLVGWGIFAFITHSATGATWHFAPYTFKHPVDLIYAVGVGLVCGLIAMPYTWSIKAVKAVFDAFRAPTWVKAAAGGVLLGVVAWKLPATRFWGETQLTSAVLTAAPTLGLLLLLAVAKMFTVSVTLAAGWRGGIIIPCFFIGACLGRAFAMVVPGLDPTLAMICGMAGVNVAVMKVPLATVLVVAAMSGVDALPVIAAAGFTSFAFSGGASFLGTKRSRADEPVEQD